MMPDRAVAGGPELVHSAIARAIFDSGVTNVFGLLGDGNMLIAQSLRDVDVAFRDTHREDGAVAMASGYASAAGVPAVATVTWGPGLTNSITALVEAVRARLPLLVIAGANIHGETQYMPERELIATTGADFVELEHPAEAYIAIRQALDVARLYRRPQVICIDPDVLEARFAGPTEFQQATAATMAPTEGEVEALSKILRASQRALILAGRGAVESGAGPALARIAEASGAVLGTTLDAVGLFHGHPQDIGLVGGFASREVRARLAEVDTVMSFGATLNRFTAGHRQLFQNCPVVIVDDRLPGHRLAVDPTLIVTADAGLTAAALVATTELVAREPWLNPAYVSRTDAGEGFTMASVLNRIHELLPPGRVIASDTGHFMSEPARELRVSRARGYYFAAHFCSVGLGISAAIGMALARPDDIPIAIVGDGGFMMSPQELDRPAAFGVGLNVIVLNDEAFGAELYKLRVKGYENVEGVKFGPVPIAGIARAYGLEAFDVYDLDELNAAVARISVTSLVLINVHVPDPEHLEWHRAPSVAAEQAKRAKRAW